jgi:hypothetical protein
MVFNFPTERRSCYLLLLRVLEVTGSDFSVEIDCSEVFNGFCQSPQANSGIVFKLSDNRLIYYFTSDPVIWR